MMSDISLYDWRYAYHDYACKLMFYQRTLYDKLFFLYADKPVATVLRPQYRALYGSQVTLECRVVDSRIALTDVTWLRVVNGVSTPVTMNSRYAGSSVRTPSLTINRPDFNDEGEYICTAENAAGVGRSAVTKLDVYGSMLSYIVCHYF